MSQNQAIIYCQNAFLTTTGKTAHGLIRHTTRYEIIGLVDRNYQGQEAGKLLDGKVRNIMISKDILSAIEHTKKSGLYPRSLVIGLAPEGGRLDAEGYTAVVAALKCGLNIDSGLHDFLSDNAELVQLAKKHEVRIRDVRKPPPRSELHFFEGKICKVTAKRIAVLGTDSAVGKRTTATLLTQRLNGRGTKAEMVGTGQTAWLQGARYSITLDSLVNDFVTGELEHAVYKAWEEQQPKVIFIEGQGSLLHPAYPGGFEIISAARPHGIVLQHAPARKFYDGFPDFPLHALDHQINALELVSGVPVIGITLNHEGLERQEIDHLSLEIERKFNRPCVDVLWQDDTRLIEVIQNLASSENL